ncbi:hypothetical protein PROFUN_01216 [Planoprotostelium fungivorum]|uniref:Par3/HAL N-terminal domain-containing protein n=1 Tax=Planoprotostelium fungivorum TaxID=1890364 RepID=A0A2P6NZF6_9EUKA|nr:hypothetical protein PROFUN_01216 [Planoprotostelium fungivorum]
MSRFHVKISLNDASLVINLGDGKRQVSQLYNEFASRFTECGVTLEETDLKRGLQIVELATIDGYTLKPSEILSDVVNSGDKLVAVTYGGWLKKQNDLIAKEWLCLQASDAVDEIQKWTSIGFHKHNKLYVQFGTGYPYSERIKPTLLGLHLFNSNQLTSNQEGRKLMCSAGDVGKWSAECHFNWENGRVTSVEVAVKSTSDPRPTIKRLPISVGHILSPNGDVVTVQNSFSEYQPELYVDRIPQDREEGPVITVAPSIEPDHSAKSVGELTLTVVQKSRVNAQQTWARDGKFNNFFHVPVKVSNLGQSKILVSTIKAEYQGRDGGWHEVSCSLDACDSFSVEPLDARDAELKCQIEIEAPQRERENRAHKSLPQPLLLRFIFDSWADKKSTQLTVQQVNPPLQLVTRDSREKYNSSHSMLFWAQCDDSNLDERIYAEVYQYDEKQLQVATKSGSSCYFTAEAFRKRGQMAAVENKKELDVPDLSWEEMGLSVKTSLLIDLEEAQAFAFRFELKTNTSSRTAHFAIPKLTESD